MWEYSGAYADDRVTDTFNCNTFSFGIYYVSKEKGSNGRKKSAVVYRVKGFSSEKEKTIAKVNFLINKANLEKDEVAKEMFKKWAKEFIF